MAEQSGVQSLERAFHLLELLSEHPDGMHLLELAGASGLHKSTVHRMLASLITLGYVRKLPEVEGKYQLTLRLFAIAARVAAGTDMMNVARPVLARLCDSTGEAVHLVVQDGSDIVYVHKAENPSATYQMGSRIGMRRPLYCTAAGKSILATLGDREVARIWEQSEIVPYTPHTILRLEKLYDELDQAKRLGYALDNEENELGVYCIAAAIRDYTGQCRGAFSVSAPIARMPSERVEELGALMVRTATTISAGMGYQG